MVPKVFKPSKFYCLCKANLVDFYDTTAIYLKMSHSYFFSKKKFSRVVKNSYKLGFRKQSLKVQKLGRYSAEIVSVRSCYFSGKKVRFHNSDENAMI